jgi:hypothetical protein
MRHFRCTPGTRRHVRGLRLAGDNFMFGTLANTLHDQRRDPTRLLRPVVADGTGAADHRDRAGAWAGRARPQESSTRSAT